MFCVIMSSVIWKMHFKHSAEFEICTLSYQPPRPCYLKHLIPEIRFHFIGIRPNVLNTVTIKSINNQTFVKDSQFLSTASPENLLYNMNSQRKLKPACLSAGSFLELLCIVNFSSKETLNCFYHAEQTDADMYPTALNYRKTYFFKTGSFGTLISCFRNHSAYSREVLYFCRRFLFT